MTLFKIFDTTHNGYTVRMDYGFLFPLFGKPNWIVQIYINDFPLKIVTGRGKTKWIAYRNTINKLTTDEKETFLK